MSSFLGFYERIWKEAAAALAAEFSEIDPGLWEIRHGDKVTLIRNHTVRLDDPVILDVAGNKGLCHRLLRHHGLPVPEHLVYRLHELQKAQAFMGQHAPGWFVVKPSEGTAGASGITLYVRSAAQCRRASALASLYCRDILIERLIPGESCRLLVLDGRLIHATRRQGLRVTGDGRATVRQLLERVHPEAKGLRDDPDFQVTIGAQGLAADSVPEAGREVLVKSSPLTPKQAREMRTVFNEDVTGLICRDLKEAAIKAAAVLRARFAGIDVITTDPARPLAETGGVINEVNTTPGLHHHYHLLNGQGPGPAVTVLKHLLDIADTPRGVCEGCASDRGRNTGSLETMATTSCEAEQRT